MRVSLGKYENNSEWEVGDGEGYRCNDTMRLLYISIIDSIISESSEYKTQYI